MIKKLLKNLLYKFSYEYKIKRMEKYLSMSEDLYDLDNRQKTLNEKNIWNNFYI